MIKAKSIHIALKIIIIELLGIIHVFVVKLLPMQTVTLYMTEINKQVTNHYDYRKRNILPTLVTLSLSLSHKLKAIITIHWVSVYAHFKFAVAHLMVQSLWKAWTPFVAIKLWSYFFAQSPTPNQTNLRSSTIMIVH